MGRRRDGVGRGPRESRLGHGREVELVKRLRAARTGRAAQDGRAGAGAEGGLNLGGEGRAQRRPAERGVHSESHSSGTEYRRRMRVKEEEERMWGERTGVRSCVRSRHLPPSEASQNTTGSGSWTALSAIRLWWSAADWTGSPLRPHRRRMRRDSSVERSC